MEDKDKKSDKCIIKRSYSEMTDDFINRMLLSSPFNSVEWVRFKDVQIDDFIRYSNEYVSVSGGNQYIYRSEKYNIKASIKRWLKKKGVKFNGDEYKIAKCLLFHPENYG